MTLGARLRLVPTTRRNEGVLYAFMRLVDITDLLVIIWAVIGGQLLRFGTGTNALGWDGVNTARQLSYTAFSVMLICVWVLMLRMAGAFVVQ